MRLGNDAAQIEAQAVSTCFAATRRIASIEWLSEKGNVMGSNTFTVVVDDDTDSFRKLAQFYFWWSDTFWRMSQGVLQKVFQ